METLEWWPEHGASPLWATRGGRITAVPPRTLGVTDDLDRRLTAWADVHAEDKLPIDGAGDPRWIAEGASLLREVRAALAGAYEIVATEPWWDEPPGER